jgi:hypothetical protein
MSPSKDIQSSIAKNCPEIKLCTRNRWESIEIKIPNFGPGGGVLRFGREGHAACKKLKFSFLVIAPQAPNIN